MRSSMNFLNNFAAPLVVLEAFAAREVVWLCLDTMKMYGPHRQPFILVTEKQETVC